MKTKLFDQHGDHTVWISKLAFYRDEVKIMQERLQEISAKNSIKEVLMEVEHFQNQILIQEKNIQSIAHHVDNDEKKLQRVIKNNPVASDRRSADDHAAERNLVETFEKNFNALRQEFNDFLSRRL